MHAEYNRIVPSADKAIVFIHGIVGTPNHFRFFLPLIPDDVSIYNMLLDGHGKGVTDFAKTSMEKWENQVAAAIAELSAAHKEIHIAAHSMGTLFAITQAIQNPSITKLFLLAVPLKLFLKPRVFVNAMKVYLDRISPDDIVAMASKDCYGIAPDRNPLHYLGWIPRFWELLRKIKSTRKQISLLSTPCVVFQSVKDELISKGASEILRRNPCITVHKLKESGHYYYMSGDLLMMQNAFTEFLSPQSVPHRGKSNASSMFSCATQVEKQRP